MSLRIRLPFIGVGFLVCISIGFAIDRVLRTHQEVATAELSIPIILISVLTLYYSIPKGARIKVESIAELGLTDLIFYIVPAVPHDHAPAYPREYTFQLQVAVSNLGDRKAVISSIQVDGFKNEFGNLIHLPDTTKVIGGMRWSQQSGFINGQRHYQNLNMLPPYVLEGDDVIVIRFRTQRGIDWSSRWTIQTIEEFAKPFQNPIVEAFGSVMWRKSGRIVKENFKIPLKVEQQAEYYAAIKDVTHDFTILPDIAPITIALE